MDYTRRIIDDVLDAAMPGLAAIAIEGAKAVGKTATASRRVATVLALNDPRQRASVASNYDLVAELPAPVFIDEWQLEPQVWQRVRQAVDDDPLAGGRFLLAGSAGLGAGVRVHSGAGRIISLVLRPMALAERGVEQPTVSLRDVMLGDAAINGQTGFGTAQYVEEILRSGFPGIRVLKPADRDRQLDGYLVRIVEKDMPDNGITVRRPGAMRAWLRAYAAATASTCSYTKILDAATSGQPQKPAQSTVDAYREHLTRLFILDPVDAWVPGFSPLSRLSYSPKHYLVDPALAARLIGVGAQGLLVGQGHIVSPTTGTWLGALFESLAVLSVRAYAEAIDAHIGHLRTKNGDHEIDIIVEASDTRCVAIEVKLSDTVDDHDTKHLNWLSHQLGPRLVDRVILNTGPRAYRRSDGVAVVPLALLGP